MKKHSLFVLIFASFLLLSSLSCSALAAVSLPTEVPNMITQTAQKDKAAIVLINSIVTGTASMPSYELVIGGGSSSSIVGTWQSAAETFVFNADGTFVDTAGTETYTGTYTTYGTTLTLNVAELQISIQYTYSISGSTLTLVYDQYTYTYTKISGGSTSGSDIVSIAENTIIVREEGLTARVLSQDVTNGGSGTGFIVSSDGYIVTNSHVTLSHLDKTSMLVDAVAYSFAEQLYSEFSQYYNIPDADKEKVVQILLIKLMNYFLENGQITDITTNFYVFNGVALPGQDIQVNSWPAFVKKAGNVYEKIGGEFTWGKDIAILKVEKNNLPTVTLGDSSKVQVGDQIFIIGYPGAAKDVVFKPETILEPSVTSGVVSAIKPLRTGIEAYQTDASIMHGNSGGPVYNMKGEVVGVATFGITEGSGVNFFLPVSLAKEFMNELNVQNTHSTTDAKYTEALNAFWHRDCNTVISKMNEVLVLYPNHPYANDYINECERAKMAGEPMALSFDFSVILMIVGVLVGVVIVLLIKKGTIPINIKVGKK